MCPMSHTSGLISGEWTLTRDSSEIDSTSASVRSRASPSAWTTPSSIPVLTEDILTLRVLGRKLIACKQRLLPF